MNAPVTAPPKPVPQDVALDAIQGDPEQERRHFDPQALEELAQSIREQGVIQPISLQPAPQGAAAHYQVIAGERRLRAARLAGLRAIPAMVYFGLSRAQTAMIQLDENEHRVDVPLLDRAAKVTALVEEFGPEAVSRMRHKSAAWVSKLVNAHRLPPVVKQIIQSGALNSIDTAMELGKMVKLSEDHDLTLASLEDARQGQLLRATLRDRLGLLESLMAPALPLAAPEPEPGPAAAPAAEEPEQPPPVEQASEPSPEAAIAAEPDAAAEPGAAPAQASDAAEPHQPGEGDEPTDDDAQAVEPPAPEPASEPELAPAAIATAPGALAALAQLLAGGEKVTATLSLDAEPGQVRCIIVSVLGAEPAGLSAQGKAARMRLACPIVLKGPQDTLDGDLAAYIAGKAAARAGDLQAYQAAQQKKAPPPAPKPASSKPAPMKPAGGKKPAPKPKPKPKAAKPAAKPAAKKKAKPAPPEKPAEPATPAGLFDQSNPEA